ncbi:hypothetical protein KSP39_PZI019049 [Platanthera zijinensis]|uniref:Transposase (putative) gypsy type domain-containing protein n=1 Tax=Platanthera zijinensis TaxID=2320716 RepID=A0AAP0B1N2_9ASPA
MGGGSGEVEGRCKCAWTSEHDFPLPALTERGFIDTVGNYILLVFVARRPGKEERINELYADELAFLMAHFEVGLRLPLWPEVRKVFKYCGLVPGQMNPNSVAVIVGFACFLREERFKFNLAVFRKLFPFRANKDETACFASTHAKVREKVNKSHTWLNKFLSIKGDFGNVPFSPVQLGEASYRPLTRGAMKRGYSGSSPGRTSRCPTSVGTWMTLSPSRPVKVSGSPVCALLNPSLEYFLSLTLL